ncbi:hypothetical protein ACIQFU_10535 [Streptomyces sp. NPDC093065]
MAIPRTARTVSGSVQLSVVLLRSRRKRAVAAVRSASLPGG